jgi:hypothetical protein
MSMKSSQNVALDALQCSLTEGVNLLIEKHRRLALYPDLAAMEKHTRVIQQRQASIPINDANKDVEHLLHHVDMLNRELRKK